MGNWRKWGPLLVAGANVWLAIATSSLGSLRSSDQAIVSHLFTHWVYYYFGLVLAGFVLLLLGIREQRVRALGLLKHVLDMAVEHDVPHGQYDDQDCKATLYRYSRFSLRASVWHLVCWKAWRWPWAGWLVPVARSGETPFRTWDRTVFRVGGKPNGYHGVAGAVWALGYYSFSSNTPPGDGRQRAAYEREEAARMHLVPEEYARRKGSGRPLSPYIYGGRIEVAGRKRWGVFVVDSPVAPNDLRNQAPSRSDLLLIGVLSRAIEWGEP